MQAIAVGNANSQNQTPPQTPAGQQPPTSLGIQVIIFNYAHIF